MDKLVSVIVPAFNREKTIKRCLESILGQSYRRLELIVIDDGSRDRTGAICDSYERKDSRVKAFHNTNSGVSYSRNYGMKQAAGDYVLFVDSDDYINQSYIKNLVEKAENEGLAVVVSSLMMKTDGKEERFDMNNYGADGAIIHDYYALQKFMGGVCGKLYRRQLIQEKHLQFHEDMTYSEDRVFNIEYYSYLEHYGIASDSTYICDYEPDQSVVHLSFEKTRKSFISEIEKIKKEKAFLLSRQIQRSDEVISDAIASALSTFCTIKGEDNTYHSFCERVKKVREAAGSIEFAATWKRRLVKSCYNNGFLYPIYVYYRHKQKRSMG